LCLALSAIEFFKLSVVDDVHVGAWVTLCVNYFSKGEFLFLGMHLDELFHRT